MPELSRRPYLLRAMLDWMVDCGYTPHLIVDASSDVVQVPRQFVKEGKIVLNISASATQSFQIGADDRLDALAAGALVELDHPEQVGQIGNAQRRHAVGGRAGDGGIHLHDPVGDRVFGVEAQVDETGSVGF